MFKARSVESGVVLLSGTLIGIGIGVVVGNIALGLAWGTGAGVAIHALLVAKGMRSLLLFSAGALLCLAATLYFSGGSAGMRDRAANMTIES